MYPNTPHMRDRIWGGTLSFYYQDPSTIHIIKAGKFRRTKEIMYAILSLL